jgi:hypothetical protein
MRTYAEARQGVIAEHKKLTSNVNHMKERNLRILYISLGVSIVLVVAGLVLLLMQ